MTERTAQRRSAADAGTTAEFERLYRANVDAVTAYFARRSAEPQVVADLTADTFVAAITGFCSFDPRKGTPRAWVFGIARRVYAAHCETYRQQQHKIQRLPAGATSTRTRSRSCSTGSTPKGGRHLLTELALRPNETARWSSWSTSPGCGQMRRQPRSGCFETTPSGRATVAQVSSPPAPTCMPPGAAWPRLSYRTGAPGHGG